jgi:hypothetical protein
VVTRHEIAHRLVDGSALKIVGPVSSSLPLTSMAFFHLDDGRSQGFTLLPAGHSSVLEENAASGFPAYRYELLDPVSLDAGELRIAYVWTPVPTGGRREMVLGVLEAASGSLRAAVAVPTREALIDTFERAGCVARDDGVTVAAPVDATHTPLTCMKELDGRVLLTIRRVTPQVASTLPRSGGVRVAAGEMYRTGSSSLMVVTESLVCYATPLGETTSDDLLDIVGETQLELEAA